MLAIKAHVEALCGCTFNRCESPPPQTRASVARPPNREGMRACHSPRPAAPTPAPPQPQARSCLLNKYRTGADSMGWHSDNERVYGDAPTIASVSLGAGRDFDLRATGQHGRKMRVALGLGDVLVMRGTTQQHWQHAIPARRGKTVAAGQPRINLTFRTIVHPEPAPAPRDTAAAR